MTQLLPAMVLVVLTVSLVPAQGQQNRCAECHVANPRAPGRGHLMDWDLSAHKRSGIGCERCHGGDAAASGVLRAHMGILMPPNTASLVSRKNVSATCGTCHVAPYSAFQKSRHYDLLKAGDTKGPTCVTCHGEAAAQLLSPDAIAGECNQCHGSGKRAPRPGRAAQARELLERVRDLRAQLDAARRVIDEVRDTARQRQLRDAYDQAEAPLNQAVTAGHSFVFADSEARLAVARERTAALYQSIICTTGH